MKSKKYKNFFENCRWQISVPKNPDGLSDVGGAVGVVQYIRAVTDHPDRRCHPQPYNPLRPTRGTQTNQAKSQEKILHNRERNTTRAVPQNFRIRHAAAVRPVV